MIYLIKHKGNSELNSEEVKKMLSEYKIRVVDDSALPRMAKIEMEEGDLNSFHPLNKDWEIFPEKVYKIPTTKRKPKK